MSSAAGSRLVSYRPPISLEEAIATLERKIANDRESLRAYPGASPGRSAICREIGARILANVEAVELMRRVESWR